MQAVVPATCLRILTQESRGESVRRRRRRVRGPRQRREAALAVARVQRGARRPDRLVGDARWDAVVVPPSARPGGGRRHRTGGVHAAYSQSTTIDIPTPCPMADQQNGHTTGPELIRTGHVRRTRPALKGPSEE